MALFKVELFKKSSWLELVTTIVKKLGRSRDEAVESLAGGILLVTSTRLRKPISDSAFDFWIQFTVADLTKA